MLLFYPSYLPPVCLPIDSEGFDREMSPDSAGSEHRVRIDMTDTTDTEVEEDYRKHRRGKSV